MKAGKVLAWLTLPMWLNSAALALQNPETAPAPMEDESAAVWEKVDDLNRELSDYSGFIPREELDGLLQAAVELIQYSNLGQEFDRLNERAYVANNYAPINAGSKRVRPALTVVSGGSGFRLGISLPYFLSRTAPATPEYEFFKLARRGWNDGYTDHGGPNEWPTWVEVVDDLDGKDFPRVKTRLLAEWKKLQPRLDGTFRRLADATLRRLEAKGK